VSIRPGVRVQNATSNEFREVLGDILEEHESRLKYARDDLETLKGMIEGVKQEMRDANEGKTPISDLREERDRLKADVTRLTENLRLTKAEHEGTINRYRFVEGQLRTLREILAPTMVKPG